MPPRSFTRSTVEAVAGAARRVGRRRSARPDDTGDATGYATVRQEVQRFAGREIDTAGDGIFATFRSLSDAIDSGRAIVDAVRRLGLDVRVGIHAGECELIDGKPCGLPVHIGARVVAAANPGEVVVTGTIRALAVGLPFQFVDLGTRTFASIPGEWRLLKVAAA